MRIYLSLAISLLISGICLAQVKNPVKWEFFAKKINETTYEIHMAARLESGWHIYSQSTSDGGPKPTVIKFSANPLIATKAGVKEVGKLVRKYEEIFEVEVKQFSDNVDFVQVVTLKANVKTTFAGTVEYMVCNDKECLPPTTQKFSVSIP